MLEQGRQEITGKTKELIQRTLDSYKTGIEVTTVNLQGVSVPGAGAELAARRDQGPRGQERLALEAQAYANDILPKAKGSAARQMEDAAAYKARIVADAEGEAQRFTQLLRELRARARRDAPAPVLRDDGRGARQHEQGARRHQGQPAT